MADITKGAVVKVRDTFDPTIVDLAKVVEVGRGVQAGGIRVSIDGEKLWVGPEDIVEVVKPGQPGRSAGQRSWDNARDMLEGATSSRSEANAVTALVFGQRPRR